MVTKYEFATGFFSVLIIIILGASFEAFVEDGYGEPTEDNIKNEFEFEINESLSILPQILKHEIKNSNLPNGSVCLDYALYYNETLHRKYPKLDIRFPRYVDICNGGELCDNLHTYVVVNGYGSECILDQRNYACIKFKYIEDRWEK